MKKFLFLLLLLPTIIISNVVVVGHRGACGYKSENTISSFIRAVELGVDAIEFDVQRCASGELVVFHDDTVDRVTNGKGSVEEKTLQELKQLVVENKETIPTLKEVLDTLGHRVIFNIELKGKKSGAATAKIIKKYLWEKGWHPSEFLVSSFYPTELKNFTAVLPQIKTMLLVENRVLGVISKAKKCNVSFVGVDHRLVSRKLVALVHKAGLELFVWTVNKHNDIKRMISFEVDGIIGDFPDRILACLI